MIPVARPWLGNAEAENVSDCFERGWITSGKWVERFEGALARFVGVRHAVMTPSGTSALHLALAALVRPGDEVLVPDMTYIATAAAVKQAGAVPILVDVSPRDGCMDLEKAAWMRSTRTKAVVPVHLFGHIVDPDELAFYLPGLYVIEDACEALGSTYKGRQAGSLGAAGCFSFYGNKVITTGEGGAVVTSDDDLALRLRHLRDHCTLPGYQHDGWGFNYVPSDIAGAVGCAQLEKLPKVLSHRRVLAYWYSKHLPDGVRKQNVETPWMVAVMLPREAEPVARLMRGLGIDTRPMFGPLHQMPMFGFSDEGFPVSSEMRRRGLVLPTYLGMGEDTVMEICEGLGRCLVQ